MRSHRQISTIVRVSRLSAIHVLVLGLISLGGLTGCAPTGPSLHGVTGIVSLDGAEIQQGSITFLPAAGTEGPSAGSEIVDGAYAVPKDKGLVAGKYRVEIRALKKTGKQVEVGSPSPPGTMMDEVIEAVAPRFNTESKLEAEIPSKPGTLDFDVSST